MDCIFQIYVNFNSLSALSISDPSWFLLDITIIGLYPSASRHSDVLHTKSERQVTTQISFWLSLLSHDELLDKSLLSCSGWNQCSLKSLGYTGQEERDYELKKGSLPVSSDQISTSVIAGILRRSFLLCRVPCVILDNHFHTPTIQPFPIVSS